MVGSKEDVAAVMANLQAQEPGEWGGLPTAARFAQDKLARAGINAAYNADLESIAAAEASKADIERMGTAQAVAAAERQAAPELAELQLQDQIEALQDPNRGWLRFEQGQRELRDLRRDPEMNFRERFQQARELMREMDARLAELESSAFPSGEGRGAQGMMSPSDALARRSEIESEYMGLIAGLLGVRPGRGAYSREMLEMLMSGAYQPQPSMESAGGPVAEPVYRMTE
jgi:hypothetical protein